MHIDQSLFLIQTNILRVKREKPLSHVRQGLWIKKKKSLGNDLLSQGVAPQVPSALAGLTSGFGMLPGVPLLLQSPRD